MKLYRVKLQENHFANPDQIVDGYLGNAFGNNKIMAYTRGEAIKKARMFGGKIELTDSFVVNYDKKILSLNFGGEDLDFDLRDGDVGDFWNSFTTKDGVIKDINFHQEDETQEPSVGIYGVVEVDGELTIDTKDSIYITTCEQIGNPENYF